MGSTPIFLCLSRDVEEGEYVAALAGEAVVWKSGGEFFAAENVCPHRGFPFAQDRGSLPITCPYHGIRVCEQNALTLGPVSNRWGFLFVGDSQLNDDTRRSMASIGKQFGEVVTHVRAPFQLWMQNTADPNHLRTVHPEFSKLFVGKPEMEWISPDSTASSYRIEVAQKAVDRYERTIGAMLPPYFVHSMVGPTLSITSFLGVFISVETAERTGDGCVVRTRFFTADNVDVPASLLKVAMVRNRAILEEDRDIVERWALGRPWVKGNPLRGESRVAAYMETFP